MNHSLLDQVSKFGRGSLLQNPHLRRLMASAFLALSLMFPGVRSSISASQQVSREASCHSWDPLRSQKFYLSFNNKTFKLSAKPIFTDVAEIVIPLGDRCFVYTKGTQEGELLLSFLRISVNQHGFEVNTQTFVLPPNTVVTTHKLLNGQTMAVATGAAWSGPESNKTVVVVANKSGPHYFTLPGTWDFSSIPGTNLGFLRPQKTRIDEALSPPTNSSEVLILDLLGRNYNSLKMPFGEVEQIFRHENGFLVVGYTSQKGGESSNGEGDYAGVLISDLVGPNQAPGVFPIPPDQARQYRAELKEWSTFKAPKNLRAEGTLGSPKNSSENFTIRVNAFNPLGHQNNPASDGPVGFNTDEASVRISISGQNTSQKTQTMTVELTTGGASTPNNIEIISLETTGRNRLVFSVGIIYPRYSQNDPFDDSADNYLIADSNQNGFAIVSIELDLLNKLGELEIFLRKVWEKELEKLRNGDASVDDVFQAINHALKEHGFTIVAERQTVVRGNTAKRWEASGPNGNNCEITLYVTAKGGGQLLIRPK